MATRFAQLVLFTFVIALINYATASPFERRADQCSGMTDVKNAFKQDANFCNFWLAAKRKNSPIPNVKPSDVSSACKCITATASPTSKTIKAPTPKPTACATKKDPYYLAMLADVASPAAFCDFWFLDPHRYRTVVPGVSPKQISSICSCITTSPKPSPTTHSTTSSTTSSHTTATSTPAETTAAAPAATSTSASATQTSTSSSTSSDSSSSSTSSASASASQDASSDSSTSTSTSSTSTSTASDSPTPKSDAAICPALSGDTLVDPSGTSYAMQCDKTYSGTVITGGSRKRQAEYTIENCLTACNGVVDCVAVSVLNGACTMLSDVDGYSTQSGAAAALNEVRADAAGITEDAIPSLDPSASSSSSSTSTISSPATTETSSDTPSDGSDGSSTSTATATVTATDASSPSTPADADSASSDSTSSSATATVTMPAAGAPDQGSSDTSTSSSSSTTSAAAQSTESSTPSTGDDSGSESNSANTQTATGTQSATAGGDSTSSAAPDTTSSAAPTETQSTPADFGSSDSTSTSSSASATASSNPVSDNLLGCSAPASSIIDGLPAVACGAGFDQALNDVLGYYSGDAADVAAIEASIIPGLSSSSIQKRALTETIQTVAKEAISTILAAAQSAMDSIVAALPGDVQTAEADIAEVSNKVAYSGAIQQVALKRGLDSVHKPGTQWKFARRAVDVPAQQLYAKGLATGVSTSTATPSSSSGIAPVSSPPTIVASGTAPTMMPNSTTFQIIPTGTAPTQAVNQTTSGLVGTGTAPAIIRSSNQTQAFPTAGSSTSVNVPLNTAPVSTSTMTGNQSMILSTGGLVASTTSSIPLSTGSLPSATSAPANGTVPSQTGTSTTAPSSTIPSPSSNATTPTTDKINSAPITITDTTKSLLLQPASDGSLFVSTNTADVSSLTSSTFVWDQTNDVVFGDSSSCLLHYFPSELSSLGASRFRLAGWGDIPVGASLLNLVPFQTDAASDPVLVAVDSVGNYLFPFACGLQGQTNKVFLVHDLTNGASILESSDLVYTIVGGVAQNCAPLALTGNGMTGI